MDDLWAALALVAILEGLVLFAFPGTWKRTIEQMQALDENQLRRIGGAILTCGLIALYLVRGA